MVTTARMTTARMTTARMTTARTTEITNSNSNYECNNNNDCYVYPGTSGSLPARSPTTFLLVPLSRPLNGAAIRSHVWFNLLWRQHNFIYGLAAGCHLRSSFASLRLAENTHKLIPPRRFRRKIGRATLFVLSYLQHGELLVVTAMFRLEN